MEALGAPSRGCGGHGDPRNGEKILEKNPWGKAGMEQGKAFLCSPKHGFSGGKWGLNEGSVHGEG